MGKVTPEGWPAHSSEDRKPDLKELLLYRTMSGLSVGPRSDSQVSSSEAVINQRPPSAMPAPPGPQSLQRYPCDTSSLGPPHLGGHNIMASKFSDNFYRVSRESSKPPLRDVKPPQFSESQLMPPPKPPSDVSGGGRGSEVTIRAPRVSSTTCQGEQKECIGRKCLHHLGMLLPNITLHKIYKELNQPTTKFCDTSAKLHFLISPCIV